MGGVEFARFNPLVVFFIDVGTLTAEDVVKGRKVRLYVGPFFMLGDRREDGDGASEGNFAIFVYLDGGRDEQGVMVG